MNIDITALSGILGSISIACWIVVFSPQIIENFRRSSAEGLSIVFIVVWLAGDVFNILGAVLQGVLPTMIILAVYYTLADIVLLLQCFYYRGFTLSDSIPSNTHKPDTQPTEQSSLLANETTTTTQQPRTSSPASLTFPDLIRRSSSPSSIREHLSSLDGTHLSPATPLHPGKRDDEALKACSPAQKRSTLKSVLFNSAAILVVCAAGVLGWWLSTSTTRRGRHSATSRPQHGSHRHHAHRSQQEETLQFNVLGQVFGYICAILYLGSRVPQLLLNYRRKSTDGISMLFFLFACVGNATYVLSILAFESECLSGRGGTGAVQSGHGGLQIRGVGLQSGQSGLHGGARGIGQCRDGEAGAIYASYIAVNFSWLLGSFGTLLLDAGVFVQWFLYKDRLEGGPAEAGAEEQR